MTADTTSASLEHLDDYRPVPLDPATWSTNLDALDAAQPKLAALLRQATLPSNWRAAHALDDFVTYRLEPEGQPPTWLGDSSAPLTRARGMLAKYDSAGKNVALPCCGPGSELLFLLEHLPPYQAVFVFEPDIEVVAAVLRANDFSAAISTGRCVFTEPTRPADSLAEALERHPGLLPPGDILLPDLVPAARIAELQAICGRVGKAAMQERSSALATLAAAPAGPPGDPESPPRLAVLSLNPGSATHALATSLARAARQLDLETLCRAVTTPRDVHMLAHCAALAEFRPHLTICVNHVGAALPATLRGITAAWILDETGVSRQYTDDGTLYLAASPMIAERLLAAGAPSDAVLDWYWGADESDSDRPSTADDDTIVLIADLPDDRPETFGIRESTHRKLWRQLRVTAARVWQTPRIAEPAKLLVRAERDCHVELIDRTLRERFASLVEQVVIPSVILERLARALADDRVGVLTIGHGWQRLALRGFSTPATSLAQWLQLEPGANPLACIAAGRPDPLGPGLLTAAERGWPLLVHSTGGGSLQASLGDVLRRGQHFEPFADVSELRRELKAIRERTKAVQSRVERAQKHVRAQHSYRRRLADLLARVWTNR